MAGLVGARAEWLWNTVTVGVLAKKKSVKAFTQSVIFRVLYLDPSRRRPPTGRCHRATVTAMVVLGLIVRDAVNCPTCTAPARRRSRTCRWMGAWSCPARHRPRCFNVVAPLTMSRRWAAALKAAKDAKTGTRPLPKPIRSLISHPGGPCVLRRVQRVHLLDHLVGSGQHKKMERPSLTEGKVLQFFPVVPHQGNAWENLQPLCARLKNRGDRFV